MTHRIRETALWLGAILGTLAIVWTGVMFAFGLTPLVFTSGSMSPEIQAGDLAFARTVSAEHIAAGDVVSVENAAGTRVTHRVVDIDLINDEAVLTLKGDANSKVDAEAYNVTSAEKVLFSVPKAGYLVSWLGSPLVMFLGGMFVMVLLYVAFSSRRSDNDRSNDSQADNGPALGAEVNETNSPTGASAQQTDRQTAGLRRKRTVVMLGATVIAAATIGAMLSPTTHTTATFSDTGTLTSTQLGTSPAPPAPTSISCQNFGTGLGGIIERGAIISWPAIPDQNGHKVYLDFRVYSDAALTQQIDGDEQWIPPAPYLLDPGTTQFNRVRTPIFVWGDAWVRVRGVYVNASGAQTWYSTDQRVYKVRRGTASTNTQCVERVE